MKDSNITLLVVDDEEINIEILQEYLEETPYRTVAAKSGEEAWELLLNNPNKYAAVLLDRMMPRMSGMDILFKIRSSKAHKGLPVIMQTAAANKEQVLEGLKAGAYYYLTKPFEKDMLVSIVETAVADSLNYKQLKEELGKSFHGIKLLHNAEFSFTTLEEGRALSTLLANACPDPEKAVLGLSELIVNAVEHGNLGISYDEKSKLLETASWADEIERRQALLENREKYVRVSFERCNEYICIHIEDQGEGFDWKCYEDMQPERVSHRHGRGIAIAGLLSFNKVQYNEKGNEVRCYIYLRDKTKMN